MSAQNVLTAAPARLPFAIADFVRQGYEPLPLSPGRKFPAAFAGGEWLPMLGWRDCDANAPSNLTNWTRWESMQPRPGVGLRAGRLRGIDLDILHPVLAARFRALALDLLGATSLERIGLAPKTLLVYRAETAAKKLTSSKYEFEGHHCQIEVLGSGQQFVVQGIHEKTGEPYKWPAAHIAETRFDDVPLVADEAVQSLIDAFDKEMIDLGAVLITRGRDSSGRFTSSEPVGDLDDISSAMGALSNVGRAYDEWVNVGIALKRALPDEPGEAFDLFDKWSRQSSKYLPEMTESMWNGLDMDDRPNTAGAGTIFHMARSEGWIRGPVRTKASDDFSPVISAAAADRSVINRLDWPEPIDLFGAEIDLGTPELPTDALPKVIETFARDEGLRLGVEPGAIAVACLAVAASCVDDRIKLQPKRHDTSWTERACLWVSLVGGPGELKTPVINAATKPLRAIEHSWALRDKAAADAYALAKRVHEEREKTYVRKPEGAPPVPPQKAPVRRALVSDVTIEALSEILPDNPGGLLGCYDELAALFGSFDTYRTAGKGRDRQDWLELYNGGSHSVDRVGRGRVSVPNWSLCLLGGIQPERLRALAPKLSDDGLVQRFLFVNCQRAGEGLDQPPNDVAARAYHDLLDELEGHEPFDTTSVRLHEDAQVFREDVARYMQTFCALPDVSEAFKGFAQKFEGFFARLVLAFHAIECASLFGGGPMPVVPVDTARRAHRLFTRYLVPHSLHVHRTMLGQTDAGAHAKWLAGYILAKRAATLTASDIGRINRALRNDPNELAKAMAVLTVMGWCRPADPTRRDSLKWIINPSVYVVYSERAASERLRREAETEKIRSATAIAISFGGRA